MKGGRQQAVVKEIPGDLETPVTAFLKLKGEGARFLLESVERAEAIGRYSFIGLDTLKDIRILPDYAVIEGDGRTEVTPLKGRDPLDVVRRSIRPVSGPGRGPLPALVGGAVGYISYDYVRSLEKLPNWLPDTLGLPLAHLAVAGTLLVFDHFKHKIQIISMRRDAKRRVEEVAQMLDRPVPADLLPSGPAPFRADFKSNMSKAEYEAAVRKAKKYIRIGDIFQVVLARREEGEIGVPPFQIYRALRILNPSPYMFFLDLGEAQLVGSSPEVHAKLTGGTALIRPIAGTRPRGDTPEQDLALEKDLLADEKERAEHLMLIDLARNDVGRCCEYGSVSCNDLFTIERYSHVMHIVSQVTGKLAGRQDQYDLVAKTFPAGTVSGAPKIRAMEIIEELERCRRGPYAGTVGYFSPSGDMDTCITIRTVLVKGRTAYLQAGAGIVADSDPAREWQETVNKLAGLHRAIDMAEKGL